MAASCARGVSARPAGAVAQLGERRNRTAEVRGSNPLGSTKSGLTKTSLSKASPTKTSPSTVQFVSLRFWGRRDRGGERGSAIYCPATISNGETQVTGSCTLLHLGQVRTWVPVRRLPSPERHSETVICQELTQERPGLQ
jgi:hypothetical protein